MKTAIPKLEIKLAEPLKPSKTCHPRILKQQSAKTSDQTSLNSPKCVSKENDFGFRSLKLQKSSKSHKFLDQQLVRSQDFSFSPKKQEVTQYPVSSPRKEQRDRLLAKKNREVKKMQAKLQKQAEQAKLKLEQMTSMLAQRKKQKESILKRSKSTTEKDHEWSLLLNNLAE